MNHFVELEFRNRKIEYCIQPYNITMKPGDQVVVKVNRGADIAEVIQFGIQCKKLESKQEELQEIKILRVADDADIKNLERIKNKEIEAGKKFVELEDKYDFEMKLLETIYQFDGNKLTFFFAADGRIDFREFVRELAKNFHTRIELHQTSGRDEAKRLGGIGMCGRNYCCTTFIKQFNQVTIKMVKDQNLSGNLSKISGPCGRLLCCLHYEENFYVEQAKSFPEIGEKVRYKKKEMYVFKNDYYGKQIQLTDNNSEFEFISLDDYQKIKKNKSQYRNNNRSKK